MPTALVTGSSGLIGSEVVAFFSRLGWTVHGVDNNMRADFFGAQGDTRWNQRRLEVSHDGFHHHELDIRDRQGVVMCLEQLRPGLIVHTAAQPSHDLAASRPYDDFDVNAVGTMNLLEATRRAVPESVFVHMSTNKVYGDGPNRIALRELPTRWDYDDPAFAGGIAETFSIDQCKHSSLRCEQGGRRRDGAGIRTVFRIKMLCPARGVSDRPEPQRRRVARVSELPHQVQRRRADVQGVRLRWQAGARQHPLVRRGQLHPPFLREPAGG